MEIPASAGSSATLLQPQAERARVAEALLLECTRALQGSDEPLAKARAICETVIGASMHLRLCWVWRGPHGSEEVQPQVIAGPAAAYAEGLRLRSEELAGLPNVVDAFQDKPAQPVRLGGRRSGVPRWRTAVRRYGLRSLLALPLPALGDGEDGAIVVYADRADYFDRVGTGLFESLAEALAAVLLQSARVSRLTDLAQRDPLTGLLNRRSITRLNEAIRKGVADRRRMSVLLLDIDHFKRVNDTHGHPFGDTVLQAVATVLRDNTRTGDEVARWGGEEFVVWLPHTPLDAARAAAEKIRRKIEAVPLRAADGGAVGVTASIGVAQLLAGEDLEHAVSRADECLYKAKRSGRNRVVAWRRDAAAPTALPADSAAADPPGQQAAGVLAALMEASADAVIVSQLNGAISAWNPAARRLLGYSAQEMVGQNIAHLLPPAQLEEEADIQERLRRGERIVQLRTVRRTKDGAHIAVTLDIAPVRGVGGTIVGACSALRAVPADAPLPWPVLASTA